MADRTPCTEYDVAAYDVAALTDHLLKSIIVIDGAAGATLPNRGAGDSVERQIVGAARPALDARHHRGLHGTVTIGPNTLPAAVVAGILSLEFPVHAWDYAKSTGHPIDVADSVAEYVLGLAKKNITPQGRAQVGFDDPVDAPDDAPPLDRLIAFTGRQP